jgi:hypothetical protein
MALFTTLNLALKWSFFRPKPRQNAFCSQMTRWKAAEDEDGGVPSVSDVFADVRVPPSYGLHWSLIAPSVCRC